MVSNLMQRIGPVRVASAVGAGVVLAALVLASGGREAAAGGGRVVNPPPPRAPVATNVAELRLSGIVEIDEMVLPKGVKVLVTGDLELRIGKRLVVYEPIVVEQPTTPGANAPNVTIRGTEAYLGGLIGADGADGVTPRQPGGNGTSIRLQVDSISLAETAPTLSAGNGGDGGPGGGRPGAGGAFDGTGSRIGGLGRPAARAGNPGNWGK